MSQFMRRRKQIKYFVFFKADTSLKCLQYDPYIYDVVYTNEHTRLRLISLFVFTVDNGDSQKTERIVDRGPDMTLVHPPPPPTHKS